MESAFGAGGGGRRRGGGLSLVVAGLDHSPSRAFGRCLRLLVASLDHPGLDLGLGRRAVGRSRAARDRLCT